MSFSKLSKFNRCGFPWSWALLNSKYHGFVCHKSYLYYQIFNSHFGMFSRMCWHMSVHFTPKGGWLLYQPLLNISPLNTTTHWLSMNRLTGEVVKPFTNLFGSPLFPAACNAHLLLPTLAISVIDTNHLHGRNNAMMMKGKCLLFTPCRRCVIFTAISWWTRGKLCPQMSAGHTQSN